MGRQTSRLNYAFAVGRIRALEKFLIRRDVFEEAIDADLSDALRLFVESDLYGDELLAIKGSVDLEETLGREAGKVKDMVAGLLLDEGLLALVDSRPMDVALAAVRRYGSHFLTTYVMHVADMHNIKTFLRLLLTAAPKESLARHLGGCGFIPAEAFMESYERDTQYFFKLLGNVPAPGRAIDYALYLREGLEKLFSERSFLALERAMHDFLIRALEPARYITFGPEPILAYLFAKDNEINLMRMIILAKLTGFAGTLVKQRLNTVYA